MLYQVISVKILHSQSQINGDYEDPQEIGIGAKTLRDRFIGSGVVRYQFEKKLLNSIMCLI